MKLIFASGLEEKFLKNKKVYWRLEGGYIMTLKKNLTKILKNLEYDYLEKKFDIRSYIPQLRIKLLNALSFALNEFHNKEFSKEYWTAIIDPWLSHYLIQNYYRWCLVEKSCLDNKNLRSIFFKKLDYDPPFDQNDFFYFIANSNSYNQFIFQRIYKFRKNEFTNLELTILDENIEKDNSTYELKKKT